MIVRYIIILMLLAPAVSAETVVPIRTIRANAVILSTDIGLKAFDAPNGFTRLEDVVGQEARVVLYPGRPIRAGDIGPPAVIARNQIVRLEFAGAGVHIVTEGRSLERGAVGDSVRIMNLNSRATLIGRVQMDGTIRVMQ
jgi:flagella basal body P-ring formation protein FlgA